MPMEHEKLPGELLLPRDEEYRAAVEDILQNPVVQSMAQYIQHGVTNCLQHCVSVSYRSWLTCKEYGLNATAAARAGLLHDMFLYDWHTYKPQKGERLHGFSHPATAYANAKKEFELSALEEEIILKHMWPLTLNPPKHKEAFVVLYHDKRCSLRETLGLKDKLLEAQAQLQKA